MANDAEKKKQTAKEGRDPTDVAPNAASVGGLRCGFVE